MKIVVNTRLLLTNKLDGIGWFKYQTLKKICQNNPNDEFIFLFDRKYDPEFIFSENVTPIVTNPQARHPFLYLLWFEYSVNRILKKIKPDLFLSPDGMLSLTSNTPQLPVIHDINFFHRPQDFNYINRAFYNTFYPKYAKKAARIATVSKFSKEDIISNYGIDENKIDVVYNGVNENFKPISTSEKHKVKCKFSRGEDYFLFVGSVSPRKNIINLIQAFNIFKAITNSEVKLIVAGSSFWGADDVNKEIIHSIYKNDILTIGRVSQEDLQLIMASALALVFVPFYEGFGVPIIEAMACETPIICSNVTSLPEIANDAALYTDPNDVNGIFEKMLSVFNNPNNVSHLIANGKKQVENYTWENTSSLLWKSICKSVN